MYYKKNGEEGWHGLEQKPSPQAASDDESFIELERGNVVEFESPEITYAETDGKGYSYFYFTGPVVIMGNIMSIIENKERNEFKYPYVFKKLFCTETDRLKDAGELLFPVTALTKGCYQQMFEGCTGLVVAPEKLPATRLAEGCYQDMFNRCTSLTSAPELPAETLANGCYYQMFRGCTNLNYIKCLATNISATNCTSNWVNGVSSTGTFVKNPSMSSWTRGVNGIPTNWTEQGA